jgi:nitrite reductase/ring-hydroxylating ferredoxin subunit
VTGAAQYYDATNDTRPRRLGALHASVNIVATALYGASMVARRNGNRGAGVALSSVGLAAVSLGGMLGGDLAYDLGLGVDHAAFEPPLNKWRDVLDDAELELGKPKRVEIDGAAVMLLRHDDGIHAIGAVCPHLGGPLDEGKIEGETVTCPWHGSVFRLTDGCLLHGPATAPAKQYETRIRAGKIGIRSLDERAD